MGREDEYFWKTAKERKKEEPTIADYDWHTVKEEENPIDMYKSQEGRHLDTQ
jgi:hypothetical protein